MLPSYCLIIASYCPIIVCPAISTLKDLKGYQKGRKGTVRICGELEGPAKDKQRQAVKACEGPINDCKSISPSQ